MEELIERQNAIDVLKETGIIQDNDLGHLVVEEIERIPTTTESKIRARAIDEFAEKLHELCGVEIGEYQYTDLLHESRIDEIAEQLKGE